MKMTCEICGKETNNQVSYLELNTWEFNSLKTEEKDFYSICYSCFDNHTNTFIDQEMDLELRKKRSQMVNKEVEAEIEAILEVEN
ncbi:MULTISPECIES: hypothetical protein [Exiguobacterium]|uniref:hypothetical protein n=1 Tax=Exiguobacterium TaxID=33986 RepID=UPI001AE8CB68|nr:MULTISPECIES: hypothetical protein [Exiguobacterium]MCT4780012.1 hypothetical protein [Exiguobacterium soli]